MHVAMYPHAELSYVLWAREQNLVMCCGPQRIVWLFAKGCSAGYGYVLWASDQMHNYMNFIKKLADSFLGK
jgi:hypothetical protein